MVIIFNKFFLEASCITLLTSFPTTKDQLTTVLNYKAYHIDQRKNNPGGHAKLRQFLAIGAVNDDSF